MTQQEMEQFAEREFPYTVHTHLMQSTQMDFNHMQDGKREAFIRGLEMDRWVPVSDRLPTKEDADEFGEIDAWHIVGRCRCEVTLNTFFNQHSEYSHWQPITPPKPKSE